ncbi:MAG: hypothetical protein U5K51_04345 [Flavobacteriaceae bacterium]|nr:hypothetical protein [Flavobacteriaceae bacterium]
MPSRNKTGLKKRYRIMKSLPKWQQKNLQKPSAVTTRLGTPISEDRNYA